MKIDFEIIEAEILACGALCVNDFNNEAKDILLTNTSNKKLLDMLLRFNVRLHCVGFESSVISEFSTNECVNFYDLAINLKVQKFDAIIDLQNKSVEHYGKMLKDSGILIVDLERLESSAIIHKNAHFNVLMPFCLPINFSNLGDFGTKYYLFMSNKFHPIADFSLQKLDMLENLQYSNAKVYEAAFALPNYIRDKLKGVVKN